MVLNEHRKAGDLETGRSYAKMGDFGGKFWDVEYTHILHYCLISGLRMPLIIN